MAVFSPGSVELKWMRNELDTLYTTRIISSLLIFKSITDMLALVLVSEQRRQLILAKPETPR